jgi:hypothetical protein
MRVLSVVMLACMLCGCSSSSQRESADLSKLTYQRDARTEECYAVVGFSKGNWFESLFSISNGITLTWVPCSPKVIEAIAHGG